MGNKTPQNEISSEEAATLDAVSLDEAEADENESALPAKLPDQPGPEPDPSMNSPQWHEFVMRHFEDNELDPNGRPLVNGLRRVGELLLGPVTDVEVTVVQPPSMIPGNEYLTLLQPAVVKVAVSLMMERDAPDTGPYMVRREAAADAYSGNVLGVEFSVFLTALAETRAEARAWRKLLKLRTVAADEVTNVPVPEASPNGLITPSQLTFLNAFARRADVDVVKFINAGKNKYNRVHDVPYATANIMTKTLSGYITEPDKIPSGIRGYKTNWLNEQE